MLLKLIDQKIRRAFSNSADQYELFASLQKEIGRELTRKILYVEPGSRLLDIGMGTGWLCNRLQLLFPENRIVGLDFSDGMVQWAKHKYEGFQLVQADCARLPFRPNSFGLIISNLSLQWVQDLQKALGMVHDCLKENGGFYATIFGKATLSELFASLEATQETEDKHLSIKRLVDKPAIKKTLVRCGFREVEINSEVIKLHFADLWDLLQWLKKIGANAIAKDVFIGRDWLTRANEDYKKNFNDAWGVTASFEVIWVKASK